MGRTVGWLKLEIPSFIVQFFQPGEEFFRCGFGCWCFFFFFFSFIKRKGMFVFFFLKKLNISIIKKKKKSCFYVAKHAVI